MQRSGRTSRPRAGHGSIRNPAGRRCTSTDQMSPVAGLDHRIATAVVDDEDLPLAAARERRDALRLHGLMELHVNEPDVVAAVPCAELKRFIAPGERTPEQNQEVSSFLIVGDVPDPLCRCRLRYACVQDRWSVECRRRPRGYAGIEGTRMTVTQSRIRRPTQTEQEGVSRADPMQGLRCSVRPHPVPVRRPRRARARARVTRSEIRASLPRAGHRRRCIAPAPIRR